MNDDFEANFAKVFPNFSKPAEQTDREKTMEMVQQIADEEGEEAAAKVLMEGILWVTILQNLTEDEIREYAIRLTAVCSRHGLSGNAVHVLDTVRSHDCSIGEPIHCSRVSKFTC